MLSTQKLTSIIEEPTRRHEINRGLSQRSAQAYISSNRPVRESKPGATPPERAPSTCGDLTPCSSARARSAPTAYAERVPPPERTTPMAVESDRVILRIFISLLSTGFIPSES